MELTVVESVHSGGGGAAVARAKGAAALATARFGGLDALPYADRELASSRDARELAEQLVQDELLRSLPKFPQKQADAVLPPLPYPETAADNGRAPLKPMATAELERIALELPAVASGLDFHAPQLPPSGAEHPDETRALQRMWGDAQAQIGAQLERLTNLELVRKYGGSAWRLSNAQLENALRLVQAEVDSLQRRVDGVNKRRKLEQGAAAARLAELHGQHRELLRKNALIESECARLESSHAAGAAAHG